MRISELRLVSPAGDTLGRIVELVLDMRTGLVVQVLVSLEECGAGERLFPLPWCALRLDSGQQCFVLQLDEQVTNGPEEDRENDYSEAASELPFSLRGEHVLH